ncbi:MAG TPA: hypothetical protein VMT99_03235 [Candidatus Paceibacterota bacterium]|nr:hypothetical protein [Candidatus Paceibacterota bacterium]
MTLQQIRDSRFVAASSSISAMGELFHEILRDASAEAFTHYDIFIGQERSVYLFFTGQHEECVACNPPFAPAPLARELNRTSKSEARYEPDRRSHTHTKGWEIRVADVGNGVTAVIALAAWVSCG